MGIPTVAIDTPNGLVLINKSDYDEDKHTLYVELEPSQLGIVMPDPSKQNIAWLKSKLAEKDVNFDGVSKKADLLKLYQMSYVSV